MNHTLTQNKGLKQSREPHRSSIHKYAPIITTDETLMI